MRDRNLRQDLRGAGASTNEAESLVRLAEQLQKAKPHGLSAQTKQRMLDELPARIRENRRPVLRWAMAGSLAGAMALVALIALPGVLRHNPQQPAESDTSALVQPVETQLQELDTQVEQLQQQDTVDEAQLQEAEEKYQRTFENFKKHYQNNEHFKNYDWKKWQREWQKQNGMDSSQVNGISTGNDNLSSGPSSYRD